MLGREMVHHSGSPWEIRPRQLDMGIPWPWLPQDVHDWHKVILSIFQHGTPTLWNGWRGGGTQVNETTNIHLKIILFSFTLTLWDYIKFQVFCAFLTSFSSSMTQHQNQLVLKYLHVSLYTRGKNYQKRNL